MKTIYLTTPIYYVNARPHLGHACNAILVDVFSRYHRQRGYETRFLTGTDEHGEKIAQSAANQGLSPQVFTDRISSMYRDLWPTLEVAPDDFIRTTEDRHKETVASILKQLWEAGEIYKGEYEGLYCVGCERFMTEKELVNGNCPEHDTPPNKVVEENYMFRMEKHRAWLRELLETQPDLIRPDRYRQEVLAILREPIGDLSISRPAARVSWGIPIPWDEAHVVYVWFDALINYLSALGGPDSDLFKQYWHEVRHVVGKDIIKQHGIFWPIMLRAAGLPCFKGLWVHGWWLVDSAKMSKSLGNVISPLQMAARYGADAFRYYLVRDMVFGHDSDFSELSLATRLNSDLANDLGNLVNRVTTMISRYCGGLVPQSQGSKESAGGLLAIMVDVSARVDKLVEQLQLSSAIEEILQGVRKANQYVQESAPWNLAKDSTKVADLHTVLYTAAETLRLSAVLLYPIIPQKSIQLLQLLGCENLTLNSGPEWTRGWGHLPSGLKVTAGEILFPRIDVDALKKDLSTSDDLSTSAASQSRRKDKNKAGRKGDKAPGKKRLHPGAADANSEDQDGSSVPELIPSQITFADFQAVQFKVADVVAAEAVPRAKRLLKLTLSVGEETRTVVSGIAEHYAPEELVGKQLVLVSNLKPAKLRGVVSQGMVLAAEDAEGKLSLVTLDRSLKAGSPVS